MTVRAYVRAGALRRVSVAVAIGALLLTTGACAAADGQNPGSTADCAGDISIAGTLYIARRGEGGVAVPHTGTELHRALACPGASSQPVLAHTIPGVRVTDAVAGPGTYALMLAQRLWLELRSALPAALQP